LDIDPLADRNSDQKSSREESKDGSSAQRTPGSQLANTIVQLFRRNASGVMELEEVGGLNNHAAQLRLRLL